MESFFALTDPTKVDILRFEDPELGPRKLPQYDNPANGKVVIPSDSIFSIDTEKSEVSISSNGKKINVGDTLAYIVN